MHVKHRKIFAVVGSPGSGRHELVKGLENHFGRRSEFIFLSDSSNGTPNECLGLLNEIAKNGLHRNIPPVAQLALFWARLATVISHEIKKHLADNKTVVISGFGGTILAHALCGVTNETERRSLITLHKSLIEACVVGSGLEPPVYLWLKSSPEVAYERLLQSGRLSLTPTNWDKVEYIRELNAVFEFYKTDMPGQTVMPVDADQSPGGVLANTLDNIESLN